MSEAQGVKLPLVPQGVLEMKTPQEFNQIIYQERLLIYSQIKAALQSDRPEISGFKNLDSYKLFIERNEGDIGRMIQEYDRKMEELEKKLGKPSNKITEEEYHEEIE